jgi:subtilisin family serine protease
MRIALPVKRLLLLALILGAGRTARADIRTTAEQIASLSHGALRHPLADSLGRLPVVLHLPPGSEARDVGAMPVGPGLGSIRLAPEEVSRFEAEHPSIGFSVWPPFQPSLDRSAELTRTGAYRALLALAGTPGGSGRGVLVGVIDTGIDAVHDDFRDPKGATRIAWLLDMDHPALGRHAELEKEFGCLDPMQNPCAVLSGEDIDQGLAGVAGYYVPTDEAGHGTHVASIAAGNGGAARRYVGMAPEAKLVVAKVTHGSDEGGSDADILNAARFIFGRADAMHLPVAVNLSLGGDYGPHDGTAPIEKALAATVTDHPGRAFVVAAGNSGGLYRGTTSTQRLGIHTETRVGVDTPALVPVLSPPAHGARDVLSGTVYVWITFRPGDVVSVGLVGPDGTEISPVPAGKIGRYDAPDGNLTAAVWNDVVNDDSGLTADTHGAVVIWQGKWPLGSEFALDLLGDGFASMWLQGTGDAAISDTGGGVFFETSDWTGTIGVPGTHPDLIAVGCTVNRDRVTDADGDRKLRVVDGFPTDSVSFFSAAGPTATGVMKPEISAPGEFVVAAMSSAASPDALGDASPFAGEVVDPTHALLSGSSMSAPQVTGAAALLLELDRSLTQREISTLLQAGARFPEGVVKHDYQLGVGALDVVGAFDAYGARGTPIVRTPDPEASWVSLSSSYLHPDPEWPINGLVAMRASGGLLADGFDERRLSLSTAGPAVITTPLSRVGPGLYRFAISAEADTGGDAVEIDVAFDGQVIGRRSAPTGHRVLPVGADTWVAFGDVKAMGGCALRPASQGRGWFTTACLLALTARGRGSRRNRAARTDARRDRMAT